MNIPDLNWQFHQFKTLDTYALFDLMKLRVDVFVVEQACAYPELDALDTASDTMHLLGYKNHALIAYARAIPPVCQHSCVNDVHNRQSVRIGRVVVAREHRAHGIARSMMHQLIERIQSAYPELDQTLAAQTTVQALYAAMGFTTISDVYLEDGIAHIDMRRNFAPLITRC